jgi:Na+-transporting NADH:ubiquinone oxidoreductase subunit NqrC
VPVFIAYFFREIDGISGATMTTNGYVKAIERAFASVKIFEGGH